VHAANVPGPAGVSSLHSNVAPASLENVNDWVVAVVVPLGPPVIVVSGAVVSIVNVRVAGVASTLPAASRARTENVCVPSASVPSVTGDVQAAKAAPSREHSNVVPASLVKVNVGGVPASVVSGAAVSSVKVRVAGVASAFPAASLARTLNV
jgi:hypothetical protein